MLGGECFHHSPLRGRRPSYKTYWQRQMSEIKTFEDKFLQQRSLSRYHILMQKKNTFFINVARHEKNLAGLDQSVPRPYFQSCWCRHRRRGRLSPVPPAPPAVEADHWLQPRRLRVPPLCGGVPHRRELCSQSSVRVNILWGDHFPRNEVVALRRQ